MFNLIGDDEIITKAIEVLDMDLEHISEERAALFVELFVLAGNKLSHNLRRASTAFRKADTDLEGIDALSINQIVVYEFARARKLVGNFEEAANECMVVVRKGTIQ